MSDELPCALVAAPEAEAARRALDRAGYLAVRPRAFKAPDGRVALPLTSEGTAALQEGTARAALHCGAAFELTHLPSTGRVDGDLHARTHQSALQALEAAGVSSAEARAALPASALPRRWEKLGDVVLFSPQGCFAEESPVAALAAPAQQALWASVARSLGAARLGIQGRIAQDLVVPADSTLLQRERADVLHRKSGARLLWPEGADGWTEHRENGIMYGLDVRRSMFSSGNGTEKMRVASRRCEGETVVDLYAGIGYFTLPYLLHARAAHLHACEWDEDALAALKHNLRANGVAERCTVHPGDNALSASAFAGTAHRVNLGLIPSSEAGWPVGVAALRPEGGWLHVHANIGASEADEAAWCEALLRTLARLAADAGREWTLRVAHLERVKWYAPKIRHCVADVWCGSQHSAASGGPTPAVESLYRESCHG